MVKEFKYNKLVDPEQLHKQIAKAGFNILGIVFYSGDNIATVMLDDSETKDPTSIVEAYVYVKPVYPDYPKLYAEAQQTVVGALNQYNTAASSYINALAVWNNAGATITTGNALTKLAASEKMVEACATAIDAAKNAISALVSVVTVLAENSNLIHDDE